MKKGDILIAANKKKHPHPIVFLEALSEGKFNACILSTKDTKGNIIMSKNHFVEQEENGNDYTIKFKNSHLVPSRIFEKEVIWLSSTEPKGKLTEEGIKFVEKYTKETNQEFYPVPIWEDFPK